MYKAHHTGLVYNYIFHFDKQSRGDKHLFNVHAVFDNSELETAYVTVN